MTHHKQRATHKQSVDSAHNPTPVSTQTTWLLTDYPQRFFQTANTWLIGRLLRNRTGDGPLQTGSSTPSNGGTYFVWLKEDDGWSANRLSAHRHYDLPSVHFPASTRTPHPPPSSPDHDVMAHDIISSGTANLPFPFFATQWTFIKSDRITSGKGCTGTGLGHTRWVGKYG